MASFANYLGSRIGQLALWRLDETSGTVAANKVTGGVAGTHTGAPTLGVAGTLADGNKAVTYNGSSQYTTMGNSAPLRPPNSVVLDVIFKPAAVNVARQSLAGCGSTTKGYLLCLENATLKFYVNGTVVTAALALATGKTYYVRAIYNGAQVRIYLNGLLSLGGSANLTGVIDYTGVTDFMIAQRHGVVGGEYFNGTVEECGVGTQFGVEATVARILQDSRNNRGFQQNLHLEFAGQGNGWTDVTLDQMGGVDGGYGMPGSRVLDRIAKTGQLRFRLNNSATNSAGLLGYYATNHANKRAGFNTGIRARLQVGYGGGFVRTLHVGSIDIAKTQPGLYDGELATDCISVDYIDELARSFVTGVPVQVDQRSDQVFSTLLATMVRQPSATSIDLGLDTYPLSLDNVRDESTTMLSSMKDLAMSELGLIYDEGGTLYFENRAHRPLITTNVDTFLDVNLVELDAPRSRSDSINKAQVNNHPRSVDPAPTTNLAILKSVMQVAAGASIQILEPYRDPNNPGERVGGKDMVNPTTPTDFKANAAADGSGADLSANVSITPSFGGNGVRLLITNTGGVPFWIGGEQTNTYLRCRGRMIADFGETMLEAEDLIAQAQYGRNTVVVDQPYQADPRVGSEVAFYVVNLYKDPLTQINRAGFYCPKTDDVFAARLLGRRISDRVGIQETISGLSATSGYYINAVEYTFDEEGHLFLSWVLAPSDQNKYWLLEIVGASELGATTRLGFGLIVGHTDIPHGDAHGDVAHTDVAHSDVTHVDQAHGDGNPGHSDTAHDDVAHSDNHNDIAHNDVAHDDSHSDVAHTDTAHGDVPHEDIHDDLDGVDFHNDFHDDVPHEDTHGDVAHSDNHNDVAHSDIAHTDNHDDTAHTDVAHGDIPAGHSDQGHGDTAHTDVSHGDVPHSDSHSDSSHGDIN